VKNDGKTDQDVVRIETIVVQELEPSSQNSEEGCNGSAYPDSDL